MELYFQRMPSPAGNIIIYASDRAVVGIYIEDHDKKGLAKKYAQAVQKTNPILSGTKEELKDYFSGLLKQFTIPVEASGTPFQKMVWKSLQTIGYGELRTYGDVARAIQRPTAVRAVGGAIGSNPISIIIPCHRVIGADSTLTGFGGGLKAKEILLETEGHVIRNSKVGRPAP